MNIFSLTPADFVSAPAQKKDGQGRFVFNSPEKKKKSNRNRMGLLVLFCWVVLDFFFFFFRKPLKYFRLLSKNKLFAQLV